MAAEINLTTEKYEVKPITEDALHEVVDHLKCFFLRDEPLNCYLRKSDEIVDIPKYDEYILSIIKLNISFMAINNSGKMVGLAINKQFAKDEEKEDPNPEVQKIYKIRRMLKYAKQQTDLFGKYPEIDKEFVIACLSVDTSLRGKGICKMLIDKSIDFAREKGFKIIKAECTSYFSAKAFARFGFECIYSLKYEDYKDNGVVIFNPPPPHTTLKVYVKLID